MNVFDRLVLPALCAALAIASAAVVLTLDRYGVMTIPSPPATRADGALSLKGSGTTTLIRAASAATLDDAAASVPLQSTLLPAPTIAPAPAETQVAFLSPNAAPLFLRALTHEDEDVAALAAEEPASWSTDWSVETTEAPRPAPGPRLTAPLVDPPLPWQTQPPAGAAQRLPMKERLAKISPAASKRLAEKFIAAGAPWPPAEIVLVAIKDQKTIELHARPSGGEWKMIHRYPILAASGVAGPKLRQGDKQVPEGIYSISLLNPNSRYHVSMRVNFPNAFDREMAEKDGRTNVGGDIMIHGKAVSAGCLAMGDDAAEELFVLADRTGLDHIRVIIAPTDFRRNSIPAVEPGQPQWLPKLYTQVAAAMSEYKAPPTSISLLSLFGN